MSVERKYNGEYCQIHIDLSKASNSIKIFSKSGKDSTIDRIRLYRALKESLELDITDCRIKKLCILERELLV
jgi:DNA ligase 4